MRRGSYPTLPNELIIDIISRLPAQPVGRCRCVCKSWRALLSEPDFIRDYFNRSRNEHPKEALIFNAYNYHEGTGKGALYSVPLESAHQVFDEITISAKKLTFPGYPDSWVQVCGSCDGLLLVWGIGALFVLNPTTRQVREVPPWPAARVGYITCGFGHDSVNDDYKIVALTCYDKRDDLEDDYTKALVNVYSLKTDTWKTVDSCLFYSYDSPVIPGAFVDGSIHWVGCSDLGRDPTIMAFDLAQDKLRELLPPGFVGELIVSEFLAVVGGHMCVFNRREMAFSVMKEYGVEESWIQYIMDNLDDVSEAWPLCFLGQEEVILVKDYDFQELVIRNLKQGTTRKILVQGIPKAHLVADETFVFVESLISPYRPWH